MARKKAPSGQKSQNAWGPLAGSLILGFLGQLCFRFDLSVVAGLLCYFAAAYIFILSLRKYSSDEVAIADYYPLAARLSALGSKKGLEWLLVLALLFIAAFFRFYRLGSQPSSLWLDEGLVGLNALEIIEGKHAALWSVTPLDRWRPDWVKTSNLYLYYVVFVFKTFGTGYFGLKMVSVLPAVASVVAVYFLFREISNVPVAAISAFLTAVSQWHITISRWGWDAVLMSLLQLVSYWLLLRGLKTGRKWHLVLSGVLMGLCLYTYIASWIALAIAVTFLVLKSTMERHGLRSSLQHGIFFLVPCLVVFAPLGAYYFQHPGDLFVRTSELTLAKSVAVAQSYYPVWENIGKYALMFNADGDGNPRHGFPHEPVLDFVTAIFFVLGFAYCLRSLKNAKAMLVLLWFALGLQGGLLADPSDSPNAYRTFMVSPIVYFFAATSIHLSLKVLSGSLPQFRRKEIVPMMLGTALICYALSINYWTYFVKRPKTREVWEEESRDGELPAKLASLSGQSRPIIVDPLLLWKVVVVNSWFRNYRSGKLFESPFRAGNLLTAEGYLAQLSAEHQLVYVYSPVFARMMRSLFPDAKNEAVLSPFGDPLYGVVTIAVADLRLRLASVDQRSLAAAIQNTAVFYQEQASADAEIGPRRKFLFEESKKGIDFAGRLKRATSGDRTP